MSRVLVTGGAGFIGASICVALGAEHEVVAYDNLHRRGSELNLDRLRDANVPFVCGDVRDRQALGEIGPVDVLIECSAEPSASAGMSGETPIRSRRTWSAPTTASSSRDATMRS